MQEPFSIVLETFSDIKLQLSRPRFTKYSNLALGNEQKAIRLYRWNCLLCQGIYWPLQSFEIATRNAVSRVLYEKYGPEWHYSDKMSRVLSPEDAGRLTEAVRRQGKERRTRRPHVDAVVASLSMGFWVSMLTGRYDVPFGWPQRLKTAFPFLPTSHNRQMVHQRLDDLRDLRNRVAHHEPILHLDLSAKYAELLEIIGWISADMKWWVSHTCTFQHVLAERPR